jgi:hypothetical protein
MNRRAVEAFQLLGIPRDSDRDAIAHAYRRLARAVHPDVSAEADACERFANLAEAYRIATTAPVNHPAVPPGAAIPIRRPGVPYVREALIVAGPVRVSPSSAQRERQRRG